MTDSLRESDRLGSSTVVRVAALQQTAFESVTANIDRAVDQIGLAAAQGARLIVTQELVTSRYFCQTEDHRCFDLAEPIPGPTSERFCNVAREHGVVVVASLFEKRAPGLFHNTAIIIERDGTIVGRYRKMHIPDDPLYYEKFYFTPGDATSDSNEGSSVDGFHAVDTSVGRLGVLICWDQWYPEAARLTALDGAEILCIPTAIGYHPFERESEGPTQLDAWKTIQRSHAIANGVFVVVANRVGHEPTPDQSSEGIDFWGHSFAAGPDGRVLAEASEADSEVLVAECDLRLLDEQRQNWPFFRDRRVDAYGDLTKRWRD